MVNVFKCRCRASLGDAGSAGKQNVHQAVDITDCAYALEHSRYIPREKVARIYVNKIELNILFDRYEDS